MLFQIFPLKLFTTAKIYEFNTDYSRNYFKYFEKHDASIHLLSNFSPLQHRGFQHETGFPCYKFSCPTLLMIEYSAGYLLTFFHSPFNGAHFYSERTGHFMSSGEPTLELIWHKHKIIALSYWSWKFSGMLWQINAKEFSRNYRQWFSGILEKSQDFREKFRTYGFGIDRGSASKIGWALKKIHLKLGRIL